MCIPKILEKVFFSCWSSAMSLFLLGWFFAFFSLLVICLFSGGFGALIVFLLGCCFASVPFLVTLRLYSCFGDNSPMFLLGWCCASISNGGGVLCLCSFLGSILRLFLSGRHIASVLSWAALCLCSFLGCALPICFGWHFASIPVGAALLLCVLLGSAFCFCYFLSGASPLLHKPCGGGRGGWATPPPITYIVRSNTATWREGSFLNTLICFWCVFGVVLWLCSTNYMVEDLVSNPTHYRCCEVEHSHL